MSTPPRPFVLHYDPSLPCCEPATAADLFPDLHQLQPNVENKGRVASIFIEAVGVVTQSSDLIIDKEAWNECVKHPDFRSCYDLSMAKLALQQGMSSC